MRDAAVTGAWSYLGRHVTQVLLTQGQTVRSLTSRAVPTNDPFKGCGSRPCFDVETAGHDPSPARS